MLLKILVDGLDFSIMVGIDSKTVFLDGMI